MMPFPPPIAAWLLERLLPAPALEYALGDLAEEYVLRVHSGSTRVARYWYWMQILRSLPVLFANALRSAGMLGTFAVAVAMQLGVGTAESFAMTGISVLLRPSDLTLTIVSVFVGLTTAACGGYIAARIRRPAALVMAAITFAIVLALMLTNGDGVPLWYQMAFLVAGPLAPLAGGAVASRTYPRRIP
jgi:hypothetical protein